MNKRIRFLRGTSDNIARETIKTLAPGQPLYNIDKNYLTIGSLKNGNEQPLSQFPITVREINGWYDDNDQITGTKNDNYRVGPTESGTLSLSAKNGIEFTVRQSATGGQAMAGGGSVGTPLIITPNTLEVNGTIAIESSSFTIEDGKHWHSSININSGAIRSIDFTDDGDTRSAGLFLNDFGGDIYLSDDNSDIIIAGELSDGTNKTTVENIVTKTDSQIITGEKKFDNVKFLISGTDYRVPLTSPNTEQSDKRFLVTVAGANVKYSNYHSKVYTQNGKLYSNNSEVVNLADEQTIAGKKTFGALSSTGPVNFSGTGTNNLTNISQAFINACGMYTLNVHTINLQTTTDSNGDNIVNVPSIVNPGTGSGGGNIGYV